ncbi:hypothetical protein ACFL9U_11335 [Thermodesulfobacteriota bacterium]
MPIQGQFVRFLSQTQIVILKILSCIPACPVGPADRTGAVKILAFLELEQIFKSVDEYKLAEERGKLSMTSLGKLLSGSWAQRFFFAHIHVDNARTTISVFGNYR